MAYFQIIAMVAGKLAESDLNGKYQAPVKRLSNYFYDY